MITAKIAIVYVYMQGKTENLFASMAFLVKLQWKSRLTRKFTEAKEE